MGIKQDRVFGKEGIFYSLFKNKIFVIGLTLKLLLSFFFASYYVSDLFAPFIKQAVHGSFWTIYTDYYPVKSNAFPYPPVMLYILAIPSYIYSFFGSNSGTVSFIDVFCLKLPLLVADFAITVVLIKWLKNVKKVIHWYWLNPIVIYISYIHGQLDIIPTAFLCLALYFLFKEKYKHFAVLLCFACASKFHIVITFPLILIYLYRVKKLGLQSLLRGIPFVVGLLLLLNLPFLLQTGFVKMVYQNQEQRKVFASFFSLFENYKLLFIPASYMVVLYVMVDFKFINKDILLIFLALSFGIVTFFLVPQPGWYLWNMPFFVYFLLRFNLQAKALFIVLNIAYLLFFIVYPQSDIPQVAQLFLPEAKISMNLFHLLQANNIDAGILVQLSFTTLQIALLIFCISLLRLGVIQVKQYKIYNQPYLIGICGDSGTGKTTLTKGISKLFGFANTLIVRGDDMHRWERGHEKWNEFTHLNPKANWLHRDLADLIDLKAGKKIMRRHYDHNTGKFTAIAPVTSNKVVIYEGLHSFYLKEASKIYDLKIFMKPSEALRRYWKIERDVKKRGYAVEKVMEAIEKRAADSNNHILIQQQEADIIFSIEADEANVDNLIDDLYLKVTSSNDVFFEHLLDHLKLVANLSIHHEIDRHRQEVILRGSITVNQIEEIAEILQLNIKEIIGSIPEWGEDYLGVMQLFIVYSMLTQFKRTGMLVEAET